MEAETSFREVRLGQFQALPGFRHGNRSELESIANGNHGVMSALPRRTARRSVPAPSFSVTNGP